MAKANVVSTGHCLVVCFAALIACGDAVDMPPHAPLEAVLSRKPPPGAAELEAQLTASLRSRRSGTIGAADVRLAIAAGRAALRIHGRPGQARPAPGEHRARAPANQSAAVRDAAALLERVTEEVGLPRLCEALLVRAELAHVLQPAVPRDIQRLQALIARFGAQPVSRQCVDGARRLLNRWSSGPAGADDPAVATKAMAGPLLTAVEVFAPGAGTDAAVRLVLYLDGDAVYRKREVPAGGRSPHRIHLTLSGARVTPALPKAIAVGAGGLRQVRLDAVADGLAVVFELEPAAQHDWFALSAPQRLVFDFQSGVAEGSASAPTVVLDPGHGGHNPGAKGPTGLRESDVALSLARRVRAALRRQLSGARVILTRESDVEVSLEERAAIANGRSADLFVSIHLNASASPDDRGGVSTFVLDTTGDEQALRLAARENGTEVAAVTALQAVLASLVRAQQVAGSKRAARAIHRATLQSGRRVLPELPDRGVKTAAFHVLVGAIMPAVLLEASFITRPEEEQALRTNAYRDALAEGIATGIVGYLSATRVAGPSRRQPP